MSDSSDNEENDIPPEILKAAEDAMQSTLPSKSRKLYMKTYEEFLDWRKKFNTKSFDETVLLAYFNELSKKTSPSTLWSKYSMIKAMLNVKDEIDISGYKKLKSFLRNKNVGFVSKKSKIFTSDEIRKFLVEAPDEVHLDKKVILIVGILGACRREELHQLTIDNLKDNETHITITLPTTKTHIARTFTIGDPFREIVMRYMALHPATVRHNNLFLNYQKEKCTSQVIGVNKIGKVPSLIAQWLKLPEPERYTGHALRCTSANLLVDAGASMTTLKRHGGWKSTQAAEGYLQDSMSNKRKVSQQITDSIVNEISCDSEATQVIKKVRINEAASSLTSESGPATMRVEFDKCSIQ